jgi:hypothetical protein
VEENGFEPSVPVRRPATRTTFDDTSCVADGDALSTLHRRDANTSTGSFRSRPTLFFIPASDCDALLRPGPLCGIELPIALFDAAGPLVPGNRGADMVRASALACSGDFLLRLAGCQGKNLIVEARRVADAAS